MMDTSITWTIDALREFLPRECGVAGSSALEPVPTFLTPEEANRIRDVNDARRPDFLAGRRAAREALAQIGVVGGSVASGAHNEPLWPNGTVGSISHSSGMAIAAVSHADTLSALGIDIEHTGAVTSEVWPEVLLPSEIAFVKSHQEVVANRVATAIFCLKEAFYKFQFPLSRHWLEFHDVHVSRGAGDEVWSLEPGKDIVIRGSRTALVTGYCRVGEHITVAAVL
jgi:4'-phosphopantetheinyl transferase EntD